MLRNNQYSYSAKSEHPFDHSLYTSANQLKADILKALAVKPNLPSKSTLQTYDDIKEFAQKTEHDSEKAKLLKLKSLTDVKKIKKEFLRLCKERELQNKDTILSFSANPFGECNKLYCELATLIFKPKNLQELFQILFPSITESITLNIKINKKNQTTNIEDKVDLQLRRQPLTELADYPAAPYMLLSIVFEKNSIFMLNQLENLTFTLHQQAFSLLETNETLHKKVYEHNPSLEELKHDIEGITLTPMIAIKRLIYDFIRFGETNTNNAYAKIGGSLAFSKFMAYFKQLPAEFQKELKKLETGEDRRSLETILNEISTGQCIEVAGYRPLQRLIDNPKNQALLNTIPTEATEHRQKLNAKFGKKRLWSSLSSGSSSETVSHTTSSTSSEFEHQGSSQANKVTLERNNIVEGSLLPTTGNDNTTVIPHAFIRKTSSRDASFIQRLLSREITTKINTFGDFIELLKNFPADQYEYLFNMNFDNQLLPLLKNKDKAPNEAAENKNVLLETLRLLSLEQKRGFINAVIKNAHEGKFILAGNLAKTIDFITMASTAFEERFVVYNYVEQLLPTGNADLLKFLKTTTAQKLLNSNFIKILYPRLLHIPKELMLEVVQSLSNETTLLHEATDLDPEQFKKILDLIPKDWQPILLNEANAKSHTVIATAAINNFTLFKILIENYHLSIEALLDRSKQPMSVLDALLNENFENFKKLFQSLTYEQIEAIFNYKDAKGEDFLCKHNDKLIQFLSLISNDTLTQLIKNEQVKKNILITAFRLNLSDFQKFTKEIPNAQDEVIKIFIKDMTRVFNITHDDLFSYLIKQLDKNTLMTLLNEVNISLNKQQFRLLADYLQDEKQYETFIKKHISDYCRGFQDVFIHHLTKNFRDQKLLALLNQKEVIKLINSLKPINYQQLDTFIRTNYSAHYCDFLIEHIDQFHQYIENLLDKDHLSEIKTILKAVTPNDRLAVLKTTNKNKEDLISLMIKQRVASSDKTKAPSEDKQKIIKSEVNSFLLLIQTIFKLLPMEYRITYLTQKNSTSDSIIEFLYHRSALRDILDILEGMPKHDKIIMLKTSMGDKNLAVLLYHSNFQCFIDILKQIAPQNRVVFIKEVIPDIDASDFSKIQQICEFIPGEYLDSFLSIEDDENDTIAKNLINKLLITTNELLSAALNVVNLTYEDLLKKAIHMGDSKAFFFYFTKFHTLLSEEKQNEILIRANKQFSDKTKTTQWINLVIKVVPMNDRLKFLNSNVNYQDFSLFDLTLHALNKADQYIFVLNNLKYLEHHLKNEKLSVRDILEIVPESERLNFITKQVNDVSLLSIILKNKLSHQVLNILTTKEDCDSFIFYAMQNASQQPEEFQKFSNFMAMHRKASYSDFLISNIKTFHHYVDYLFKNENYIDLYHIIKNVRFHERIDVLTNNNASTSINNHSDNLISKILKNKESLVLVRDIFKLLPEEDIVEYLTSNNAHSGSILSWLYRNSAFNDIVAIFEGLAETDKRLLLKATIRPDKSLAVTLYRHEFDVFLEVLKTLRPENRIIALSENISTDIIFETEASKLVNILKLLSIEDQLSLLNIKNSSNQTLSEFLLLKAQTISSKDNTEMLQFLSESEKKRNSIYLAIKERNVAKFLTHFNSLSHNEKVTILQARDHIALFNLCSDDLPLFFDLVKNLDFKYTKESFSSMQEQELIHVLNPDHLRANVLAVTMQDKQNAHQYFKLYPAEIRFKIIESHPFGPLNTATATKLFQTFMTIYEALITSNPSWSAQKISFSLNDEYFFNEMAPIKQAAVKDPVVAKAWELAITHYDNVHDNQALQDEIALFSLNHKGFWKKFSLFSPMIASVNDPKIINNKEFADQREKISTIFKKD